MKPHSFPAYESTRTSGTGWLQLGFEQASDQLYWMHSPDLLFVLRPTLGRRFVYETINPAFESHLGRSVDEIRGIDVSNCLNRDDARSLCEALRACLAEGVEVRIRHRLALAGPRQNIETTIVPVMAPLGGAAIRLIGSHRPMRNGAFEGETKKADEAKFSIDLASVQEDIQQRIASDLHDSTCQHLIAASLGLMRIRRGTSDPLSTERLCDEIDASIDEALRELRAFSYLLHPRKLTEDGLKAAIENYADGFAARTSLRVTTRIVPDVDRLPYEKQRALLRIVQEALTNIFRHAQATEVGIVIDATDSHFRLTVSDNGRGFPAYDGKQGAKGESIGVGIPAMKARLEQIGGALDISSDREAQHSGTILRALLPRGRATSARGRRKAVTSVRPHAGTH
ncbi:MULTISPECIES: ATP-binding protein [unclassified Bradyrhizobium]|uniref:sensor histidine kinase n=1 Tax=unclassified Bradyrhizobium TaxID=2631580 RepID=UPI00244B4AF1|nr:MULTISPECIES: ATP-binding protein [unclassified Bradyrhizobium]MDH2348955.1 histidine kinase [Bradyrhizobium sp. SSUT77]MDH2352542.1 histidine kinase [Bradyrhizobium sp. SSUT112]